MSDLVLQVSVYSLNLFAVFSQLPIVLVGILQFFLGLLESFLEVVLFDLQFLVFEIFLTHLFFRSSVLGSIRCACFTGFASK